MTDKPKREPSPIEVARDAYIAGLTPEERSEKGRKAVKARWAKRKEVLIIK